MPCLNLLIVTFNMSSVQCQVTGVGLLLSRTKEERGSARFGAQHTLDKCNLGL